VEQYDQQQQPFGSLLRRHRTSAGLTQEQLAERAGLSRRGIADLERGARLVPYPYTIDRLATGLGLSEGERASLVEAARAQKTATPRAMVRGRRTRPALRLLTPEAEPVGSPSKPNPRHNLPQRPNRFVGRDTERGRVAGLLRASALVTLVGPGGVGKTRLALEVAADQTEQWRDGVWLLELSAISDAGLVPRAVGAVLGVPQQPGREVLDDLVDWLRDKHLLLVLDNCEHLLEACGRLIGQLLRGCPGVRVLATSREVLGIEGEAIWRVDPLAVPDVGSVSAETARESEAVRLFAERASAAAPDFTLTDQNAAVVARSGCGVSLRMASGCQSGWPRCHRVQRCTPPLEHLSADFRVCWSGSSKPRPVNPSI
jgi:transcriptional regulator with XRE-family HTH domain